MAVAQKLACRIEQVVDHGERVYSVELEPQGRVPRFRAGQFLHLALDPYDPSAFWPESRVFSIASAPTQRDRLKLAYAVHGRFTARMEAELVPGRDVWVKMPYGDFVVEGGREVVLIAGGTGITAFTAFLEDVPADAHFPITLLYGARRNDLLIYRDVVERCASRVSTFGVWYFVEQSDAIAGDSAAVATTCTVGRVSLAQVWPSLKQPLGATYYLAGPPSMLDSLGAELHGRGVAPESVRIDAWE